MTTIISIKGKNTRMGALFKTPKHLLKFKGQPAIQHTISYMRTFGDVIVVANEDDHESEKHFSGATVIKTPPDNGIVDMLCNMELPNNFFVVDCDVIPLHLNIPDGTTVYCFENKNGLGGYSNFEESNGNVIECNEKGRPMKWAGAGVYFFQHEGNAFKEISIGCSNLSHVMARICNKIQIKADTTSKIFRFGSLQTILNNE